MILQANGSLPRTQSLAEFPARHRRGRDAVKHVGERVRRHAVSLHGVGGVPRARVPALQVAVGR